MEKLFLFSASILASSVLPFFKPFFKKKQKLSQPHPHLTAAVIGKGDGGGSVGAVPGKPPVDAVRQPAEGFFPLLRLDRHRIDICRDIIPLVPG